MRTQITRQNLLATTMIAGAAMFALAAPAMAQEDTTNLEEVVVTGSRIQSVNLSSTSPVQVLGEQRLEGQGNENIADVLTSLPQFAPSFGASRTQSTFSGTGSSGLNVVNLRNLGSSRSLVLINGRRAPSGTISSNAVDLNSIPSANIERIEIVTGGASAVYGADAVSGVVNIILDDDFEGVEVGASYGAALEHGDNENPSAFIRFGSSFDRGYAGLTLQYDYQGEVSCADRYICAEDFFWNPPGEPNRSPTARSGVNEEGRFFIDGAPGSYTVIDGVVVPFDLATHGFNRNAARTLAIPTERIMVASNFKYDITDNVRAFAEINYSTIDTDAPFEAHPFQSFPADLVSGLIEPSIPSDNPFVPDALRDLAIANGDDEITWYQRFSGLGARGAQNQRQTARFVAGIEGEFDSIGGFGSDWSYEASYVYGRTTLRASTEGLVARDALFESLRVIPDGAGGFVCANELAVAQGCIPVNPFDGYNADEAAYLVRSGGLNSESELQNALAFISGTIYELPAGPLQIALGVESRRIEAFEDYSTEINLGTTTGNQISDSPQTNFQTNEAYIEVKIPLLRDLPFVNELNIEGAYRVSDSREVGNYDTYKYGGDWSPVAGLRLRGAFNRAARAPVLGEVTGISQTFGVVDDPCILYGTNPAATPTLIANCQAEGIPDDYEPPITVQQGVQGFIGGNADLQPEFADTVTYGVQFQASQFDWMPATLSTLSVSVDRFQIEIEGLINTVGRQNIADLCYTLEAGPRDVYCSQITRQNNPSVPGADYVLFAVNDQLLNIASFEVAGVDIEVNYSYDSGDWGVFGVNSIWTHYDKAEQTPFAGSDPINLLGAAGGSTSDQGFLDWQGNTAFSWNVGAFSTTWTARYIDKTLSSTINPNAVEIDAEWYNDAQIRYRATDTVEIYAGINNIFDVDPPFFPSSQSGTQALDTVPAYYDVFGRSLYAGFKARF